ncbi:MAG: hypothetical protein LKCHEGNO_03582 [Burkholderiaceae bacterium]|nr:hypothetical protein [Burkholderiaceae bacterium]
MPRRRRVSAALALGIATLGLADLPALAASTAADRQRIARTFTAFCDTLVPADELTPSASALRVPDTILDNIAGDALAERLLAAGCNWLDAACKGAFAAASEGARIAACEQMQALPWQSPPGRFFQLMRNTVMAEYYVQPASWHGLALTHAPQPLGFFDAVR